MKALKLLQVGDLHYPELVRGNLNVDQGDSGFPTLLQSLVATPPSQVVAREMARLLTADQQIQGVLICGDLTSKGDLDGFEKGLHWLAKQLGLESRDRWSVESVHAVPGNHDINRRAVTQGGPDIYKKFEELERAWRNQVGDLEYTVRTVRTTLVGGSTRVAITSLNSCLGCGEYRGLPDTICDALWRASVDLIESQNIDDYNALQYEQLDTPAFDELHISELVSSITASAPAIVPIVLAHHNLLPQGLVRISPYTELVNGGNIRRRLSNCGRSVLYLHGHIHDDPIEDITRLDGTTSQHGSLITISAPELCSGFNVLSIVFSRLGHPIGCAVEAYRRQQHGDVILQDVVKIPLVKDANTALSLLDEAGRSLLHVLSGTPKRFHEVLSLAKQHHGLNRNVIEDRIREVAWLRLAILINEDQEPDQWQIQGVRP